MFWLILANKISQYMNHKVKVKHIINALGAHNVYIKVQTMASSTSIHQKMEPSASIQPKEHVQSMYKKMKSRTSKEPHAMCPHAAPSPAHLGDLCLLQLHWQSWKVVHPPPGPAQLVLCQPSPLAPPQPAHRHSPTTT